MVRTVITALYREVRGLHEAAYLLGVFAVLSQMLALVRDRLLAGTFGADTTLDVYYAAFRVPDLLFAGVATLFSFAVILPFLADRIERSVEEARELLSDIVTVFGVVMVVLAGALALAAPWLLPWLFPGIAAAGATEELITVSRILLLQPILLGLSGIFAGVTQLAGRFAVYAAAPVIYNAGIIVGIVWLYPTLGVAGLGWGVVLGAVAHASLHAPILIRQQVIPRLQLHVNWSQLRRVVSVGIPRTLAVSSQQLTLLVLTAMAARLQTGAVAVFHLAFNLHNVPLAIVGTSYSVAAFPTLARLFSRGEQEAFRRHVTTAARHILFWSIPILVLTVVLRAQLVRVILGSGAFDWADTRLTAAALALFILSLAAHGIFLLLVRAYHAAGRTLTPFTASATGAVVAVASGFGLLRFMAASPALEAQVASLLRVQDVSGATMLALPLGYTIGMLVAGGMLAVRFQRDFGVFGREHVRSLAHAVLAALAAGVVAFGVLRIVAPFVDMSRVLGVFLHGFVAGIAGIAAGIAVLAALKNHEIREVWRTLHHRFWKRRAIASDELDV